MALLIALEKDEAFYVDDDRYVVLSTSLDDVRVKTPEGRVVRVSDKKYVRLAPDVDVMQGYFQQEGVCQMMIRAPRNIIILREALYEQKAEAQDGRDHQKETVAGCGGSDDQPRAGRARTRPEARHSGHGGSAKTHRA